MTTFPEPRGDLSDCGALFARYLDFFRETVIRKAGSLPPAQRRASVLPSGWTPLEMLAHLAAMERRWLVWGFLGEPVDDPWREVRDDSWHVPDDVHLDDLAEGLREVGARTAAVLAGHALDEVAQPGPRFEDAEPPSLSWICFHVLQEYARHAGHLDVAVEVAGGEQGE